MPSIISLASPTLVLAIIPLTLLLFVTVSGFHFPSNLRALTTVTKPCLSPTVTKYPTIRHTALYNSQPPAIKTSSATLSIYPLVLDWQTWQSGTPAVGLASLSYSYLPADKNFGKLVACEVSLVNNNLSFMLILYWLRHITSVLSPWFTSPIAH